MEPIEELEAQKRLNATLLEAGVPARYFNASKADFDPGVFAGVESLFITGGVGVGKTHYAFAVMREFFREKIDRGDTLPVGLRNTAFGCWADHSGLCKNCTVNKALNG